MKIKLWTLALALLTLTGCSLALPEQEQADKGVLCGFVITRDHLDEDIIEATEQENGRLGFDIPGAMTYYTYSKNFPEGRTTVIESDGAVSGVKSHIKESEEGTGYELRGILYVPTGSGLIRFYFNPVYQRADDSLYLAQGRATAASGDHGPGFGFTHKLEETVTVNGVTRSCLAEVEVKALDTPKSIRVLQMDEDGAVLAVTRDPGAELTPVSGCAYLICEHVSDQGVTRSLWQPGDKAMEVFEPAGSIIKARDVKLNWPD